MKANSMESNPYTPSFGKPPAALIPRAVQEEMVMDAFTAEPSPQNSYMITGVRGTGKTVFLYQMAKKFKAREEWIVVSLNPNRDMLQALLSRLANHDKAASIIKAANINLSFFGLGVSVNGVDPVTDTEVAITRVVENLARKKRKLLITVDEASNTEYMRVFAGTFQELLGQDLPVYILMTGLYENINTLQNERTLTFLYRMPRIDLSPLDLTSIAENYKEVLPVNHEQAWEMAGMTKGYSYAFQTLGDLTWQHQGDYVGVVPDYRQRLEEYVYEKIWSELSDKDRQVVYGVAVSESGKVQDIRSIIGYDSNSFTQYRNRLIKRGILVSIRYGYIGFSLPYFKGFARRKYEESNMIERKDGIFRDL